MWQRKPGLPTWPEVRVQEEVGQQGQVKLPPAERGLVLAGGQAGASSACRLRGGQLNRLGGLYGKRTICQASAGLSYTTCGRWKPVRTPGQQGPHSSLPASTLPCLLHPLPRHMPVGWTLHFHRALLLWLPPLAKFSLVSTTRTQDIYAGMPS